MKANRILRFVRQFNVFAIAGASLLVLGIGAFVLVQIFWYQTRPIDGRNVTRVDRVENVPTALAVGSFSWLERDRTLWAPVEARQSYRFNISSKSAHSVRNYVVYDTEKDTSLRLLPDNNSVILEARPLGTTKVDGSSRYGERTNIRTILAIVVSADTNGDGYLTRNDKAIIGLARPDGSGFKRLPLNSSRLLAAELRNDESLLLMVKGKQGAEAVTVTLPDFEITRRTPIDAGLGVVPDVTADKVE